MPEKFCGLASQLDLFEKQQLDFLILMAVQDATEMQKIMDTASSELKFLMTREGVDAEIQVKIYEVGVTTVNQFAALCKDQDDLREMAKADLQMDPSKGLAVRAKLARLLSAFSTAKGTAQKSAELEGEATVRNQPKLLQVASFQGMRDAFEAKHWELEDKRVPSRTFMERRLEGIEKNDLRVEHLSEVTNLRVDDEGTRSRRPWMPPALSRRCESGQRWAFRRRRRS